MPEEKFIQMDPCVDCNGDWALRQGEHDFYQKLVKEKPGFQMPKRCPDCREKKRQRKFKEGAGSLDNMLEHVREMMKLAKNERYSFHSEDLITDLKRIEDWMEKLRKNSVTKS